MSVSPKWIKLPCSCGDKVYIVNRHVGRIFVHTVVGFLVGPDSNRRNFMLTSYFNKYHCETRMRWGFHLIGKSVFFSREEAEAKLAEIGVDEEPFDDGTDLLAENARLKSELVSFQSMKYSESEDVDCYCE